MPGTVSGSDTLETSSANLAGALGDGPGAGDPVFLLRSAWKKLEIAPSLRALPEPYSDDFLVVL